MDCGLCRCFALLDIPAFVFPFFFLFFSYLFFFQLPSVSKVVLRNRLLLRQNTSQTINKALIHCSEIISCSPKPIGHINTSIKALGCERNTAHPRREWWWWRERGRKREECHDLAILSAAKWEFKLLIIDAQLPSPMRVGAPLMANG